MLVSFAFLVFRPQGTEQALKGFIDWLTSHERQVAAGVCLFAGAFMVITGTLRVLSWPAAHCREPPASWCLASGARGRLVHGQPQVV